MDDFVDYLLRKQGIDGASDQVMRRKTHAQVKARLIDFLNRRLIAAMPSRTLARFDKLMDTNPSAAQIQQFVNDNLPNRDQVARAAMTEFMTLYLGDRA